MAVTQAELAARLKAARENCGLTQQQVADALGVARTAVVQIEAGRRSVNSLELERMARLYGRALSEFLSEGAFEEDPVLALFRVTPGVSDDPTLGAQLRRCTNLCREVTRLEQVLGLPSAGAMEISYAIKAPSTRWEAICQGRSLAEQERNRLGLGASPVWEIAEIIRAQGVRATEYPMPDDISGIFLHSRDLGLIVVINRNHPRKRRLFSYAHEYCHVLVDRQRPGTVSRVANREELVEIRANAFAAHFLMPEAGVRAFLQTLGKGEATRQIMEVFDSAAGAERTEQLSAQKRTPAGSQVVQVHDVVGLAHHFGASYDAALYQLSNLKVLTKDRFDALKEQRDLGARIARALRIEYWDENAHWSLAEMVLALGFEAYRRGEISRSKLLELAGEAEVPTADVEAVLAADGGEEELVDAITPE
jgi:transcriptional regulator with XRE-family HTH domain